MSRTVFWPLFALILALAAALRLPQLDRRPMHTDEAVHAVKLEELWWKGTYVYDPHEYHGPTLYYTALPILWISGVESFADFSETQLRLVPVIFGLGLILLLPLVSDGLGRTATLAGALLTAVSTAFTFYSRYYIQETLLVFFTFLTIAAGWRYVQSRKIGWAALAGLGLGLMHATKETCIIAFGCMAVALFCAMPRGKRNVERPPPAAKPNDGQIRWSDAAGLAAAAIVALFTSILFYSAFFTNAAGPLNSILTYGTYFERAGNRGLHDHPWHFYFERLLWFHRAPGPAWTEWPIAALALVGCLTFLPRRNPGEEPVADASRVPIRDVAGDARFLRFLLVYTVLMTGLYTVIPYKTPWCALGFLHGWIVLAGVGVAALTGSRAPRRTVLTIIGLIAAAWFLADQTRQANTRFRADNRNPYVYAHPVGDVLNLASWIHKIASVHPDGRAMFIAVYSDHSWPLRWYLRGFSRVGDWEDVPESPDAPVMVVWPDARHAVEARKRGEYDIHEFGWRPSLRVAVYTRRDLYDAYRASQPRAGDGSAP